ncbi:hypothetical protein pb186bvf_016373 [Paramecium bursaria]
MRIGIYNEGILGLNKYYEIQITLTIQIKANSYVYEGFLFPNVKWYDFVSDFSQQLQGLTIEQGVVLYKLKKTYIYVLILEQANIGSIVSLLYFFHILQSQLIKKVWKMMPNQILQRYFILNLKILQSQKPGWFYKIDSKLQTNSFYDVIEYKQYYEKLSQIAEQKLCISNLIFELSILQFAIQQLVLKKNLQNQQIKTSKFPCNFKTQDIDLVKQYENQIYKQPSNDSRIIEIYDKKENDLEQVKKQKQSDIQIDLNFPTEKQMDSKQFQSEISDFALFCQQT